MIRLVALVAAVGCAAAALHLSGATASRSPAASVEVAAAGDQPVGFADIIDRVGTPAAVAPVAKEAGAAPHHDAADSETLVAVAPFVPVRLEVPAAGVRAPIDPMGLEPDGELEIPENGGRTGWWSGGPPAGAQGPTVIVGHVDFRGGQAGVFHALDLLQPGDRARIRSEDGRYLEYEITRVETFAKADFPTDEVYAPTPGAELRLITCGGPFSPLRRSYRDNVVAYATLLPPAG